MVKINEKFNKIKTDFINETARIKIDTDTKRQIFSKANNYDKEVVRLYPIYLDNYVKIMKSLYFDFNIKEAVLDGEKTKIKEELKLKDQCKDIVKDIKRFKIIDKLNVNKKVRRWWILSTILQNYKDALLLLEKYSGQNIYKNIDIEYELQQYEFHKYLIEKDLGTLTQNG